MRTRVIALASVLLILAGSSHALRDGKRFDAGAEMSAPAAGAPTQTARLAFWIGQWDVVYESFAADSLVARADATSEVTFMNRGHALMERFYCTDYDGAGNDLATIAFTMFNKANDVWAQGVANSYTEKITMFSGGFEGERLVMHDARRHRGGVVLTHYRRVIDRRDEAHVVVEDLVSTDFGKTWKTTRRFSYTRRPASDDFMAPSSAYGEPAPGLPPEARQFDFLIGEWNNSHDITFPNGQNARFPTHATAVYALNGHAVMEHSWYDVDPNLPDAATTIVRLYNRQMRRWECMYSTNRFNGILHFGGVKEGNRIMLHQFDADASDSPISQWIFHDMGTDSYDWHANTSRDRGETWKKTWLIHAQRK